MRPGRLPVGVQLFQNWSGPPRQNLAALRTASTPNAIADRSIPRQLVRAAPKDNIAKARSWLGCDAMSGFRVSSNCVNSA
ncbi:hypothetical protein SAMN03159448_03323 [Sinorhizobium sp. NFACC03]|nr:hypothetical protein SAMN03159448_03323 [Sinorhizobium sp. NFACC03]